MALEKINYSPGDVLTSAQMNKIQDATIANEKNIESHIGRYDNPHKVTAKQVGAAPEGYGYGEVISITTNSLAILDNNLNTILNGMSNGEAKQIKITNNSLHSVLTVLGTLFKVTGDAASLLCQSPHPNGTIIMRIKDEDGWSDWMYSNPPMELGVEYLTTEYYRGAHLYTKLIDLGVVENQKAVSYGFESNEKLIWARGTCGYCPLPRIGDTLDDDYNVWVEFRGTQAIIHSGSGWTSSHVYVQLWYTK